VPMMTIRHEGGMSSSINVRHHHVVADVAPASGGEDRGPTPVELLVGSLGTCIAFYVARWCHQAGVPYDGLEIDLDYTHDREAHCIRAMNATVRMPPGFPEARREALLKVATSCTVHNTLCALPQLQIALAPEAEAAAAT
jgi:putative redox protein